MTTNEPKPIAAVLPLFAVPDDTERDVARRAESTERDRLMRVDDWWRSVVPQLPKWDGAQWEARAVGKIERALDSVDGWHPLDGRGLVLVGPSGHGKTVALNRRLRMLRAALYRDGDVNPEGARIVWTTEGALAAARRGYRLGSTGDGLTTLEQSATTARLLVVDEVGFAMDPRVLFEIVDARYTLRLATTITSGLRPAELVARYGIALWRRLLELGDLVDLFGPAVAS